MATAGTRYRRVDWRPVLLVAMVIGISAGFVEKGCYQDHNGHHILGNEEYELTSDQFPINNKVRKGFLCGSSPGVACHIHCLGKNRRYFAFRGQAGGTQTLSERCYCINEPPGDQYPGRCNYSPCGSVNSGGALNDVGYASVYKVFDTAACFRIPAGTAQTRVSYFRDRPGIISPAGKCRAHCLDQGTPFFGIRATGQRDVQQCNCLDENTIDFPVLMNSPRCHKTCEDIPCGGDKRYTSIYTVCPPGYKVDSTRNQLCALPCECPSGVCHVNGTCVVCPRGLTGQMCQDGTHHQDFAPSRNTRDTHHRDFVSSRNTGYMHHQDFAPSHNTRDTHHQDFVPSRNTRHTRHQRYDPTHNTGDTLDYDVEKDTSITCEHGRTLMTDGSFYCDCDSGYERTPDWQACTDINECTETGVCRNGRCVNTDGSFHCLCNDGFTASLDHQECKDINECTETGVCRNGRCVNTDGSFLCLCNDGFTASLDLTECKANQNVTILVVSIIGGLVAVIGVVNLIYFIIRKHKKKNLRTNVRTSHANNADVSDDVENAYVSGDDTYADVSDDAAYADVSGDESYEDVTTIGEMSKQKITFKPRRKSQLSPPLPPVPLDSASVGGALPHDPAHDTAPDPPSDKRVYLELQDDQTSAATEDYLQTTRDNTCGNGDDYLQPTRDNTCGNGDDYLQPTRDNTCGNGDDYMQTTRDNTCGNGDDYMQTTRDQSTSNIG